MPATTSWTCKRATPKTRIADCAAGPEMILGRGSAAARRLGSAVAVEGRRSGQAMIWARIVAGLLALVGVGAVLGSVLRTVVLPRGVPARLARVAFLLVRAVLRLRLRVTGRSDYATRDRVFALQAPVGLFAQLLVWSALIWLLFAVMFWSLSGSTIDGGSVGLAMEQSGSSMLTLRFERP